MVLWIKWIAVAIVGLVVLFAALSAFGAWRWSVATRALTDRIEQAGLGRLLFSAPFIPTLPGTDRYADELW